MGYEIEQPESLGGDGGNYIDKPGTYHLVVTEVDENPAAKDGSPIDALKISVQVLAGTNSEQKDRSTDLTLWSSKERGDMASKKITRFFLAVGILGNHQPGQRVVVEPSHAVGRQLVAKFGHKQKKNEATGKWEDTDRIELHFADMWHVDDLEVAKNHIPLDAASIALIPPALRRPISQGSAGAPIQTSPAALVSSQRNGVTTPAVDVSSL